MILAVDIGGTAVKMALVDREGRIGPRHSADTAFDRYKTPILDTVIHEGHTFLARECTQVDGIGVSATGQIDTASGVVIGTNGLIPNYEGTQIQRAMEAEFDVSVRVLNDANAAALGECFTGRAKGLRYVVMVTVGTGIGGGIIIDGKIYEGSRGLAGEIGLCALQRSKGGIADWYETSASTSALVRTAVSETGEANLNGRIIFDRLRTGDPVMRRITDAWLDDIAIGLISLTHIFNPEMLLLGGGVSAQEALFVEPLRRRVLCGVRPRFAEGLRIEAAALGNDAGLIGAAKYWMDTARLR